MCEYKPIENVEYYKVQVTASLLVKIDQTLHALFYLFMEHITIKSTPILLYNTIKGGRKYNWYYLHNM